jgi:DNA-binding MarR family transcriptional regulator
MASIGDDPMSQPACDDDPISAVRAFTRFYTTRLGVLDQRLLKSPFSLSEARVLYEIANRENPSATAIGTELGLDAAASSRNSKRTD